jgi:hypothetical protein
VAEFLENKFKIIIKSKFTASNTLLNSAEYSITRKEHFSFLAQTSCQDTATVTYREAPSPVCAPTKRASPEAGVLIRKFRQLTPLS